MSFIEVTNCFPIKFKTCSMIEKMLLYICLRTCVWGVQGSTSEPITIILLDEHSINDLLDTLLYIHRLAQLLVFIRETSLCSGQKVTQQLTTGPNAESKCLWSTQP